MAEIASRWLTGSRMAAGVALTGLAMSVGWGIRGDYGHEAGAMIPGALLGLAICIASGREDWWRRASIMGLCGAIGWAFGGQMSYGRIIGYTAASSSPDVLYGYASLFVIGGLWAGIGSVILAMSVTQPASWLERFARPLVALWLVWFAMDVSGLTDRLAEAWSLHDTDWMATSAALAVAVLWAALAPSERGVCALIALLAVGWWIGYLVLVVLLGLHMTPPRSDNWAGCAGLFVALILYAFVKRDRVALKLGGYGFLIGGVGFVLGDFANMLGRAQWGPIGQYAALQGLDYWKWMEQSFGLIMGLGIGGAFLGTVRPRLAPPPDDSRMSRLRLLALAFLLIVMMWLNLSKNVGNWLARDQIPPDLLGLPSIWWLLIIADLLSTAAAIVMVLHRLGRLDASPAGALGRAQLLFLIILWIAVLGAFTQALPSMSGRGVFLVHVSFWITAGLCSVLVVIWHAGTSRPGKDPAAPSDCVWRLGWRFWICLAAVPLLLLAVAYMTTASHEGPLSGSHLRFSPAPAVSSP